MIRNARALRQEHVPSELVHRDGEIDVLTAALGGGRSGLFEDVIVTGPSGSGKTATTKFVLRKLEEARLDVETGFVDCIAANSSTAALAGLLRESDRSAALNPRASSASELLDRIRELDGQFVGVLDEADVLEGTDAIHSLYELPDVSVVLIAVNDDDLFLGGDPGLEKRLRTFRRVEFSGYRDQQLVDILSRRVEVGLAPGSVADEVIERIADAAAGDARLAIAILRRAAKHCVDAHQDAITADVVGEVEEAARSEISSRYVEKLSTHQRVLYEIVDEQGPIQAGDLYEAYRERVSDPRAERTLRSYLKSMQREGLVEKQGGGRYTSYLVPS